MTITVDEHVGFDLGAPVKGIPMKIQAGSGGKAVAACRAPVEVRQFHSL